MFRYYLWIVLVQQHPDEQGQRILRQQPVGGGVAGQGEVHEVDGKAVGPAGKMYSDVLLGTICRVDSLRVRRAGEALAAATRYGRSSTAPGRTLCPAGRG